MTIDLGHIADVGSEIRLRVLDQDGAVVSLATASSMQIWFKKPDNTYKKEPATLLTDGTDGYLKYVFDADDLNCPGDWLAQAYVVIGALTLHSTYYTFRIDRNLE